MTFQAMTRKRSFDGQVAVVTGAGSGIGRALARQLAADGAKLAISDVDVDGLAETVALIGARVRTDRLDVTDRAAVVGYAESVAAEFGVVNLVINNAGVAHGGNLLGMSFADIERVIDVDFWGVVNGTKAFLPHLIASGRGSLVNMSSLFGLVPMPSQSAYVAAKYAVRGFTETLRMEMLAAKLPVHVTCVHPGGVKTGIARNGTVNAGEPVAGHADYFDQKLARTSAQDAAAIILRGAAHGRPRVLVGNDARLAHALETVSSRAWQRVVATGFRRVR
jgi:NAD(P)-dependent dehydrogenase (short-subunit alcohol dehydrogenase family)